MKRTIALLFCLIMFTMPLAGCIDGEENEDEELATLKGEDTTGRNKAERIYPNIEKSIVDYYAELDNPEDQEMFYDYLIANLKLYFDKWDGEMSKSVEEPTNDAYSQATTDTDDSAETDDSGEAMSFSL